MNKTVFFQWESFPTEYFGTDICDTSFGPLIGEEVDETITIKSCTSFSDFSEILYIQTGLNDERPWIYLVKHKDGYYVYFDAWCDYTGFSCRGYVGLTYSKNRDAIINFGPSQKTRDLIESNIKYIVKKDSDTIAFVFCDYEQVMFERSDTEGWTPMFNYNNQKYFRTIFHKTIASFEWSDTEGWTPRYKGVSQ